MDQGHRKHRNTAPILTDMARPHSLGRIQGLEGGFFQFVLSEEDTLQKLTQLLSNVYTFLTIVGGIMFGLYFLLGALNWVSAGGKQEQVEKAKKMMTDAAIGLIIIVVSYPVVYIVGKVLGLEILHPEKLIPQLGPGGNP